MCDDLAGQARAWPWPAKARILGGEIEIGRGDADIGASRYRLETHVRSRFREGGLWQVWKVSVTSEGASGDLREVMPVLLAQARPYFGKSSGRKIDVKSRPDGPEVQAVRTGVPPIGSAN